MIAEIFEDIQLLLKNPESVFESILSSTRNFYTKPYILFSFLLNTYYVFLPSYLIIFNILSLFIFFLLLALSYYFMQEIFLVYQETKAQEIEDEKFFYKIAYCFAIANIPSLCLNLLANVFCLVLLDNILVALFMAALMNVPVAMVGVFYSLKVLKVVSNAEYDLQNYIEISFRSLISAVQENFGLRAMQELFDDFKAAK